MYPQGAGSKILKISKMSLGIPYTLAKNGFQEATCGGNHTLKSKVTHPQAGIACTGSRCLASDCCTGLYCTNNLGTPNHFVRLEANGWGWRDVCPTGQQPLSPTPMYTHKT